jgi:hypothetical protein
MMGLMGKITWTGLVGIFPQESIGIFPFFHVSFRCQFSQPNQSIEKMEVLAGSIDELDLLNMICFSMGNALLGESILRDILFHFLVVPVSQIQDTLW